MVLANSSALLQQRLKENGFTVEAGVAGIPTAFVATYGSGQPVIAILAEFDALPGLSQTNAPEKQVQEKMQAMHVVIISCFLIVHYSSATSLIIVLSC